MTRRGEEGKRRKGAGRIVESFELSNVETFEWVTGPARGPLEERLCGRPRRAGLQRAYRFVALDGRGPRCVDGLGRRSPERCDCRLGGRFHNPIGGRGAERGDFRRARVEASSNGEQLVADETKPNGFRGFAVKEERADRILDVSPQLLPGVSLGEDGLGQALGDVATVRLLGHLEHDLGIHTKSLPFRSPAC
jgi:hypothetical protein